MTIHDLLKKKNLKVQIEVKLKIILLTILLLFFSSFIANAAQDNLESYRKKIDKIDAKLIALLGKRMAVVTAIGHYKANHNIQPLQPKRFEAILQKNILLGQHVNLSEPFIRALMNAIHEESLAKEKVIEKK